MISSATMPATKFMISIGQYPISDQKTDNNIKKIKAEGFFLTFFAITTKGGAITSAEKPLAT